MTCKIKLESEHTLLHWISPGCGVQENSVQKQLWYFSAWNSRESFLAQNLPVYCRDPRTHPMSTPDWPSQLKWEFVESLPEHPQCRTLGFFRWTKHKRKFHQKKGFRVPQKISVMNTFSAFSNLWPGEPWETVDYVWKVCEGEVSEDRLLSVHSNPVSKVYISTRKCIATSEQKKVIKDLVHFLQVPVPRPQWTMLKLKQNFAYQSGPNSSVPREEMKAELSSRRCRSKKRNGRYCQILPFPKTVRELVRVWKNPHSFMALRQCFKTFGARLTKVIQIYLFDC